MPAWDDVRTRRWIAVAVVCLLFLVLDAAAPQLDSDSQWPYILVWGLLAGQFHLIVLWGALSEVHVVVRWPLCFLAWTAIGGALVLGIPMAWGSIDATFIAFMGVVSASALAIVIALLSVPRYLLAWRWAGWGSAPSALGQRVNQFRLRHVFLAVCLISIALAIGRGVVSALTGDRFPFTLADLPTILILLAILTTDHLLIAVPGFWCASLPGKNLARGALGYAAYCLTLGPLIVMVLIRIFGPPQKDEVWEAINWYTGAICVQGATVYSVLLYSRGLGCTVHTSFCRRKRRPAKQSAARRDV